MLHLITLAFFISVVIMGCYLAGYGSRQSIKKISSRANVSSEGIPYPKYTHL